MSEPPILNYARRVKRPYTGRRTMRRVALVLLALQIITVILLLLR